MGGSRYPPFALGMLAAAGGFQLYVVLALGPELARTLRLDDATLVAALVVNALAVSLVALPLAGSAHRGWGVFTSLAGGTLQATATGLSALAGGPGALIALTAAAACGSAPAYALHPALVTEAAPRGTGVRALAMHRAAAAGGGALAAALAALLGAAAGLTWRGVLLVLAGLALAAVLIALRLREPASASRSGDGDQRSAGARLGPLEVARALLLVPTVRRLLVAMGALGLLAVPLLFHLLDFLEDTWRLDSAERGALLAGAGAITAVGLVLFASDGERLLARGPDALLKVAAGVVVLAAAALTAAATVPWLGPMVALLCAAIAGIVMAHTALLAVLMSIVRPDWRAHAGALAAMALAGAGGVEGLFLFGALTEAFETRGALVAAGLLAALAGVTAITGASQAAVGDSAATVDGLAERSVVRDSWGSRSVAPALSCHGLRYAYESDDVIDGLDLTAQRGEVVALLGANGAGKSTLLKLISGLLLPTRGSVRIDGHEVTYLGPERRVALGLAHFAGADAVFDALTVEEELRLAAGAARRQGVEEKVALDEAFGRFPALAGRAGAKASTLSGGERQQLGLAHTLMLRPRLLLVDELSRGLARDAREGATGAIRALAAGGTTVLVVEQSVDLAVSLAPRACFLEGGRLVFDGPAQQLRERRDLIRSVFLDAGAGGL